MWEAIQSNKRRSWILLVVMAIILVSVGALIGSAVYLQFAVPDSSLNQLMDNYSAQGLGPSGDRAEPILRSVMNPGTALGALVASGIWTIMLLVTLMGGERIVLAGAGARRVVKEAAPQLFNIVEEMTIAASLPKMPAIYIIEDEAPNAFATGRSPDDAAVAVTSGLLKRLNRDELQGVIAHEIAHVRNLDVRFMTYAAIMVGSIVLLAEVFLRYLWYGGASSGRRSSRSGGGGYAALIIMVVAILAAILAPVVANMLYFACSRKREYLADACSAQFTRYPDGLASALEKIALAGKPTRKPSRTLAPMYIINPLQSRAAVGLFATHPPTDKRIMILRTMGGRAGFVDYEAAYRKVYGRNSHCLDQRTLKESETITARQPSAEPSAKEDSVTRAKEVAGILDHVIGIIPIACACGANLKIPAAFASRSVRCPRCGNSHQIPTASTVGGTAPSGRPPAGPMTYKRTGSGWESFKCGCGAVVQLSPSFNAEHVSCRKCGRHIKVL